jgi:hypothetical protein
MKVTILEAGRAPGRLSEDFPRYPDMFASLLVQADEGLSRPSASLTARRRPIPGAARPR